MITIPDFRNLDKKSRMELIITSAMVLIFIIVIFNSAKSVLRKVRPPKLTAIAEQAAVKEIAKLDIPFTAAKQAIGRSGIASAAYSEMEKVGWGRDPFSTSTVSEASNSIAGIVLEGVLWDEVNPSAIINGEVVRAGEKIGAVKIVSIDKDGVTVNDGSKDYKLQLW